MKITFIEKILILATILIMSLTLLNKFIGSPKRVINSVQTDVEKPVKNQSVADLGITVEEFKIIFNKNALERNVPQMQITNFEFGTGKNSNAFGYKFVNTFFLLGELNPETGNIKDLRIVKALVLGGSDEKAEFQVAALAFLIMVKSLSPEINSEGLAAILEKFSKFDKPYIEVETKNIKYSQALIENKKVLIFSADIKK